MSANSAPSRTSRGTSRKPRVTACVIAGPGHHVVRRAAIGVVLGQPAVGDPALAAGEGEDRNDDKSSNNLVSAT